MLFACLTPRALTGGWPQGAAAGSRGRHLAQPPAAPCHSCNRASNSAAALFMRAGRTGVRGGAALRKGIRRVLGSPPKKGGVAGPGPGLAVDLPYPAMGPRPIVSMPMHMSFPRHGIPRSPRHDTRCCCVLSRKSRRLFHASIAVEAAFLSGTDWERGPSPGQCCRAAHFCVQLGPSQACAAHWCASAGHSWHPDMLPEGF